MSSKKSKFQIVEQIKKLRKLAASENGMGNDAAAERCAEKIAELRAKHDITAEIILEDTPVDFDGEPYFTRDSPLARRRRIFWQETLGGVVAVFFGCTTMVGGKTNIQLVVGDRESRKRAIECFHLLYKQGVERAAALQKKSDAAEARLQNQSFLLGFALGVQQRLAGYKFNEAQLQKYRHHLPESAMPVNPQGIVKPERIVIAEKNARQERIEQATTGMKHPPKPVINALDDESYVAGMRFGHECDFPEAVETAAKKVYDLLEEIEMEIKRKALREAREGRRFSTPDVYLDLDLGTLGGDYTTMTATYSGVQINFDFD